LNLLAQLNRSRWLPLTICPAEGDLPTRCRAAGVETAIVPIQNFRSTSTQRAGCTVADPFAIGANIRALFISAHTLAVFLQTRRPALIVTKGLFTHLYGGLAARWAKIPCVWHVQDRVSNRLGPLFPWTLAITGRVLAREIIVDAESIARQLTPIVPSNRITVIWNGVDTHVFFPRVAHSYLKEEWRAKSGDLLIGVIGRLTRWKGQHVLIQALAEIADEFPNARVIVIGTPLFDNDAYARSLQDDVARLGLGDRVLFAGFRWDLPAALAALDIVAHTALEKDSTPLAVVSAMASGKPIVCTRVDGTAQLFDEGVDGLLVPPGDADALAQQLRILLRNADLRDRLGRAARAKAERELSVEQFARRCESVFERALR
ncbi:MAG: glycosyltransferase family 4 protein, partial [Chloroflexota bacterium]